MHRLKTLLLVGLVTSPPALWLWGVGNAALATVVLMLELSVLGLIYLLGPRIVLLAQRASPIESTEFPRLHHINAELAHYTHVARPKLYMVDSATPNMCVVGRSINHTAIVLSYGLLDTLTVSELKLVMAQQMAQITLGQVPLATFIAALLSLPVLPWRMRQPREHHAEPTPKPFRVLLKAVALAPVAWLVQVLIARSERFRADATSATWHNNALELASALRKIENGLAPHLSPNNVAAAHLFILCPLSGIMHVWFNTHPPTAERVRRLERQSHVAVRVPRASSPTRSAHRRG